MDIFLLRHGAAESYASSDQDRELTPAGRLQVENVLRQNAAVLSDVQVVAASPYVRTQQTCQIALNFLPTAIDKSNIVQHLLVPSGSPALILKWLENFQNRNVFLVGHQPLIGMLLDGLCGLEPGLHRMTTGALAHIKTDILAWGLGELQWLRSV